MLRNYCDENGFVFLDREESEKEPGWFEMTPEEVACVQPMSRNERRAYAKWHAREDRDAS
jgi:hypothetical protein